MTASDASGSGHQQFQRTITQFFRARLPYVWVQTWEEERLLDSLAEVCSHFAEPRGLHTWGRIDGFAPLHAPPIAHTETPLAALEYIERSGEAGIYVLKDFHACLSERTSDQTERVIRKMRDLVSVLKVGPPKHVVIVSPSVVLPHELQKDITLLPFELPTIEEIRQVLRRMTDRQRRGGRIHVDLDDDGEAKLANAALGLTLQEAENAFLRAMVNDDRLDAKDVEVVLDEKRNIIARTEILEFVAPEQSFDDVGGLDNLKAWLLKRTNAWLDPARRYGLPFPKGLLITGVPGCGKSLTAKCTSAMWDLPLLRLDVGRIFGSFVGDSEQNMRTALHTAEAIAPSIIWIDEIEKGFAGATGPSLDSGTSSRVFGTFLTWMQEKTKPVFVIATANKIDQLPPEFLRKGRFDEVFFVDLPTLAERRRIVEIHLGRPLGDEHVGRDLALTPEVCDHLAELTDGFSGAEIEQATISALFEAFADHERPLRLDDLRAAIESTVPLSTTQAEQIDEVRRWAAVRAVAASAKTSQAPPAQGGAPARLGVSVAAPLE